MFTENDENRHLIILQNIQEKYKELEKHVEKMIVEEDEEIFEEEVLFQKPDDTHLQQLKAKFTNVDKAIFKAGCKKYAWPVQKNQCFRNVQGYRNERARLEGLIAKEEKRLEFLELGINEH